MTAPFHRAPVLRTAALALALAACASTEPPPPAPPPAVVKAPGGLWVVTDIFESGRAAGNRPLEALIGQRVRLDAAEAGDILGRTCPKPAYRQIEVSEAAFLGALARVREYPRLRRPLAVTEVVCGGEPFGAYAQWHDGSLLARSGPLVVRLDRADVAVVPAKAAAAAPLPPIGQGQAPKAGDNKKAPAAAKPTARPEPASTELVFLASYRNEKHAQRGWLLLKAKSPTLAGLTSKTKPVDLGEKGKFVRLFAVARGKDQARTLCGDIKAQVPDCGAAGRW
ncbi:MAG: hypothetical protein HYU60_06635 [Magnetospirillum sp.]|nr:hypothetical protein [Magnetospirillum sp.]